MNTLLIFDHQRTTPAAKSMQERGKKEMTGVSAGHLERQHHLP